MNFELTEEQRAFHGAVRSFAERHLHKGALARAHRPDHPWDVARLTARQGLLGITVPEKDGGQGGTLMDAVIAIGTVAQSCPRSVDVVQAGNFGAIRVLAEFQGLQWKFADMKVKLDAGQLLLYRAATNADRGFPSAEETDIAKAYCNQAGFEICSEAMQIMGGMGYTDETLVEWCFRKCRGWMIAGGSIEILKNRIAESVIDRSFSQRPVRNG